MNFENYEIGTRVKIFGRTKIATVLSIVNKPMPTNETWYNLDIDGEIDQYPHGVLQVANNEFKIVL